MTAWTTAWVPSLFTPRAGPRSLDLVLPDGRLLGARSDCPVNGQIGVQVRPRNYARFSRLLIVEVPTDRADAIYAFARSQVGKPYDDGAILAFFGNRDWRSPDAWFCSELVAAAFDIGGFWPRPWALPCPTNKIDPADLLLLLGPYLRIPCGGL